MPPVLDQAGTIGPVRAFSGLTWNERPAGPLPANLTLLSYGGLGLLRKLSGRGGLEVVPCHYSSLPRMFARSSRLPLSAFAATIETDRPLPEAPAREPDPADRAIGELAAGLIEDGDTGMITDGVLELIERGVATGAKKEIDQGLAITGAALGSAAMYGRLPEFPVEFRPASYTHDPVMLPGSGRWCR